MSENENEVKPKYDPRANLKMWPKGTSGNPAGRPRRRLLSEELTEVLQEHIDPSDLESPTRLKVIARALAEKCQIGDVRALDVLVKCFEPKRPSIDARRLLNVNVVGGSTIDELKDSIEQFVGGLPRLLESRDVK